MTWVGNNKDSSGSILGHPKKELALASLKELGKESGRVLDFGCGDAVMVQFFHEHGYESEGADISEVVINNNKKLS